MRLRLFGLVLCASLGAGHATVAAGNATQCGIETDFNSCILAAVDRIHSSREGLGYGSAYFTQDLDYGPSKSAILASRDKPKTMCVAAVAEVVVEALNIYYRNTNDPKPFEELPAARWNHSSALDIRDYVWENRGSHSAGAAFARFGVGEELDFSELRPGDFLSFDRHGSGHSTIFISYLDRDYNELSTYSQKVVGFKYYSSQSSGVPGFAYRWAFFSGADGGNVCDGPDTHPGLARDCHGSPPAGVIRSSVRGRGGRMYSPIGWHVRERTDELVASLSATVRPVVEQQMVALLAVSAEALKANPNSDIFSSPPWAGLLAQAPALRGQLASRQLQGELGSDPRRQDALRQTPAWRELVAGAVADALGREAPEPEQVDPKFLAPLD